MTKTQFQVALKKCGVTNVNDPKDIMKYVRRLEWNNGGITAYNPKDETNIIKEIDWNNELLIMMVNEKGRWRPNIKPMDLIENVVGIATEYAPEESTNIIENPDGSWTSRGMTQTNMDTTMYGGSVFDIVEKLNKHS